ncbi:drug/metabolite transporter (DMT)-like permease [Caldalkalibacillus uzonensis]|uniref:Drug/metabolite transporter (DMT)-like permease n=1 Tax=Caldalkalibacillus uzonensis TaxID=353224 RepID=A0ABU0CMP2_9BACI|nr:DMT family transporter [Caldalkalibacillus uzonensis]MDQ0337690.1 drug/metabolite transporter (DMT)-like permease [Caldalkalibacillus uzonensis]
MWFVAALLSALIFGLAGFTMKFGSTRHAALNHLLFGLYLSGSMGFAFIMAVDGKFSLNGWLILAGLVVGIGSTWGNWLFMKALELGPASLTSPFVNLNIVWVVIMSVWVYDEVLSVFEVAAILLLVVAVSLLPLDPQESLSIRDRRWYGLVFLATLLFFLRNGGLKITEEWDLNNTLVLFYAYLFGTLWSWWMMKREQRGFDDDNRLTRFGFYCGMVAGIFSFAGMQLYAHALSTGPASIVSPVFATNSMVVAILSVWLLRERLSLLQVGALTCVMAGIVMLRV